MAKAAREVIRGKCQECSRKITMKDGLIRRHGYYNDLTDGAAAMPSDLGAQFRSWTWSPIPKRFQRTRWNTGMPRRVIRFSTEQATLASVFWAGNVRARRLLPMMVLKRNMAVSACDRRP